VVECPECGSDRTWKYGFKYLECSQKQQRYLCRNCGFCFIERSDKVQVKLNIASKIRRRFNPAFQGVEERLLPGSIFKKVSDNLPFQRRENIGSHAASNLTVVAKSLNNFPYYTSKQQVGASEKEAKNLQKTKTETENRLLSTATKQDVKGLLAMYEVKLIQRGLKEKTVGNKVNMLKLLIKRHVNLLDPESVWHAIDKMRKFNHATSQLLEKEWAEGSKKNAMTTYFDFAKTCKLYISKDLNFHKYSNTPRKLPFIPLEKEIDGLIAGSSKKVATFLQLLKETFCRAGEAWHLEWINIDSERNVITINAPEKHGTARQVKVSAKLISMLNKLPKKSQRVFGDGLLNYFRKNFLQQRRRVAMKLQNPRMTRITFHTLRHFGATMEYHKTKDILLVQRKLGHRDIKSTLIYTHLVNFEGDEYHTATSKSLKKDEELLKAGFEYVTERDGIKIYRKRK